MKAVDHLQATYEEQPHLFDTAGDGTASMSQHVQTMPQPAMTALLSLGPSSSALLLCQPHNQSGEEEPSRLMTGLAIPSPVDKPSRSTITISLNIPFT